MRARRMTQIQEKLREAFELAKSNKKITDFKLKVTRTRYALHFWTVISYTDTNH